MLNNDPRIDYLTANASLIRLASVRLRYILLEKTVTHNTLKNLQFDLDSKYDRDSANYFLEKLGSSLSSLDSE